MKSAVSSLKIRAGGIVDQAFFEALSFAMRYWFLFVMAIILILVIAVSVGEYRQRKWVMGEIGRYVGFLDVVDAEDENLVGIRFGLFPENSIGSLKKSDVYLKDPSVLKTHALMYQKNGDMYLSPMSNGVTTINGRRASKAHKVYGGDIITFGDVTTRLFLRAKGGEEEHDD